ncbi:Sugar transferase [uncultured Desulfatiglans sp.]|nr:Sugar transferase [uncultured Desulfatiglans sp.]
MNGICAEGTEVLRGAAPRPWLLGVGDFLFLNVAFWTVNSWKGGPWHLSDRNFKLLLAFWGGWFLVSLGTRKFRIRPWKGYWVGVWDILRSGLYLAYAMALVVVLMGEYAVSRGQVFGTCLVLTGLELAIFMVMYPAFAGRRSGTDETATRPRTKAEGISSLLMLADMALVGLSFFLVHYFKRGDFELLPGYEILVLLFYGTWFVCSSITGKFRRKAHGNFYQILWPWLKAGVLMFLSLALIVFLFRFAEFSRIQVFGSVVVLVYLESILVAFYVARKQQRGLEEDVESLEERQRLLRQERLEVMDPARIQERLFAPVRGLLRDRAFKGDGEVFDFLDQALDLRSVLRAEMVLRDSSDLIQWDLLEGHPVRLVINLRKINDMRWVNRYLLEAHNMLLAGGWLVVMAHTIQTHREWMFQKYPRVLAHILYTIDFAIHRVAPKLPWIKQLYFSVTKGRDRRLSRAEVLGRIRFCGFEISAEKKIHNRLYVVAQKLLSPSHNEEPSYGPLVKLRRLGYRGEVLSIYKFRTMHPYSEFIQDYVVAKCGLLPGGKIRDDFRLTAWGKVMRRLWLDELPMLYNLVKGDLQLFGVRPLSAQYFGMYPKDLQELRMQAKPGLVPPFYADMPESFEEICESERRYLRTYLERKVRTQIVYFWKAFHNIVFNGARSK